MRLCIFTFTFTILPSLFVLVLACHSYISFHFYCIPWSLHATSPLCFHWLIRADKLLYGKSFPRVNSVWPVILATCNPCTSLMKGPGHTCNMCWVSLIPGTQCLHMHVLNLPKMWGLQTIFWYFCVMWHETLDSIVLVRIIMVERYTTSFLDRLISSSWVATKSLTVFLNCLRSTIIDIYP